MFDVGLHGNTLPLIAAILEEKRKFSRIFFALADKKPYFLTEKGIRENAFLRVVHDQNENCELYLHFADVYDVSAKRVFTKLDLVV